MAGELTPDEDDKSDVPLDFINNVSIKHVQEVSAFGILVKLLIKCNYRSKEVHLQLAQKQLTNQDNLVIKD
jgi:hypothetical protein